MSPAFEYEERRDIKVYQIDKSFYEFADIDQDDNSAIIQYIVDQHRSKTHQDVEEAEPLPTLEREHIQYILYVYRKDEADSHWKDFLPSEIVSEDNFTVFTVSFVLFCAVNSRIFAIVGGAGIFVIKRYINQTFGLDLFEKIADPAHDIVISIESRGISGNLSSETATYRNEQRLEDSLSFNSIPNRITLQIRDVLLADVFDFLGIDPAETVYADLSTSFYLKHKLTFEEMHLLIDRIDEILDSVGGRPLSRFARLRNNQLIDDHLRLDLYARIRDDMVRTFSPTPSPYRVAFDIDFIHPSKTTLFYECNRYTMTARNARGPFFETQNHRELYRAGLEYIYSTVDINSQYDFNQIISGIRVRGYVDTQEKTHAMFVQHLTAEITYQGSPIFHIDSKWYQVRGDFISAVNQSCSSIIAANYLEFDFIDQLWGAGIVDEGEYNLQYQDMPGYMVLDKMLGQNIELCDILYEDEERLYLVHVKNGFDAKIRDLSNQIIISANRLWHDLKSGSQSFITSVLDRYNRSSETSEPLAIEEFSRKFDKEIIYVMAFKSELSNNQNIISNIDRIRSNIAKFSLIQTMREMQSQNFPLRIFEISRD